jgi:hypothetical protein
MGVRLFIALTLAIVPQIFSAAAQTPEATSRFGRPLVSVAPAGEEKARLDANLARAQADYDRDPASADAAIWRTTSAWPITSRTTSSRRWRRIVRG